MGNSPFKGGGGPATPLNICRYANESVLCVDQLDNPFYWSKECQNRPAKREFSQAVKAFHVMRPLECDASNSIFVLL